jgi:hypothetical protein
MIRATPIRRKIRHVWETEEGGPLIRVRNKSSPNPRIYRRSITKIVRVFEGQFDVRIDVGAVLETIVQHAARNESLQATLLNGAVRADCIKREIVAERVIALPLEDGEEIISGTDEAGREEA